MACCDLLCTHISNTGSSKSFPLSTTGYSNSLNVQSIPVPPRPCLSEMVWFSGRTSPKCWCQGCREEHDTPLPLPFSHSSCSFSRIRCAISLTCDRSASRVTWTALKPQGGDLSHDTLLWTQEVTWTLHVGHMVPACLLLSFNSTRSHRGLHRWGRARAWPYFRASTEWAHSVCDNKADFSHLRPFGNVVCATMCNAQYKFSNTVQI